MRIITPQCCLSFSIISQLYFFVIILQLVNMGTVWAKLNQIFIIIPATSLYIFSLASKALLLSLKGDKGMKASESYLVNKFIISLIMSSI